MTRHEIARALADILADMPRSRNVDSNSDRIERAIQTLELRWGATLQVVPDNLPQDIAAKLRQTFADAVAAESAGQIKLIP